MKRKAEMGMGTLIIFIAMVLVAAVAAAVLISTTGSLQNKALATGKDTKKEVGTSLNVLQVYAENGTNQDIEEFTTTIKLNAGSDAIRFSDLLLTISLNNQSGDYTYSSAVNCSTIATTNLTNYGITYSIQGTDYKLGYLNKGDVVKMCYQTPRSIGESEPVQISLIPKIGTPRVVEADTPDLMVNLREEIFP